MNKLETRWGYAYNVAEFSVDRDGMTSHDGFRGEMLLPIAVAYDGYGWPAVPALIFRERPSQFHVHTERPE